MSRKWLAAATLVGVFAGCSAAGPEGEWEEEGSVVEPEFDSVAAAATGCPSYTGTVAEHVAAGRAVEERTVFFIFVFTQYYTASTANSTRDYLGDSPTAQVTLYEKQVGGYTTSSTLCGPHAVCGDGVTSGNETCEPPGQVIRSCAEQAPNAWVSGDVRCTSTCTVDTSECRGPVCGDGIRQASEVCDGTDLAETDCSKVSVLYTGGTLGCDSNCNYDFSGCVEACGDGVLGQFENCDGDLFAGGPLNDCSDVEYPNPTWPWNTRVRYLPGKGYCDENCQPVWNCQPPPGCYYIPGSIKTLPQIVCF